MNTNCYFCGSICEKTEITNKFLKCSNCNSFIIDRSSCDENSGTEYSDDSQDDRLVKSISSDVEHYKSLSKQSQFEIFKSQYNKLNKIASFGGGFPKLESLINPVSIDVYDCNCVMYEKYFSEFSNKFVLNSSIKYINAQVDSTYFKSVDLCSYNMVSFVHFLEHLEFNDMSDLLRSIPKGLPILIYGPDTYSAKDDKWVHFVDCHVVLFELDIFVKYIRSLFDIKVIFSERYGDDMFLLFRRI